MTRSSLREAEPLEPGQLHRLEIVSLIEATTLVLLVVVAVPLKHLAHLEIAVRIMGPVHGLAFLAYVWTALQTVTGGGWRSADVARLFLVGFVPFAGFANLRFLRARAANIAQAGAPE